MQRLMAARDALGLGCDAWGGTGVASITVSSVVGVVDIVDPPSRSSVRRMVIIFCKPLRWAGNDGGSRGLQAPECGLPR